MNLNMNLGKSTYGFVIVMVIIFLVLTFVETKAAQVGVLGAILALAMYWHQNKSDMGSASGVFGGLAM